MQKQLELPVYCSDLTPIVYKGAAVSASTLPREGLELVAENEARANQTAKPVCMSCCFLPLSRLEQEADLEAIM